MVRHDLVIMNNILEVFTVHLPNRVVVVDADEYVALAGLLRKDPLKGMWDKIPHRKRCEGLFAKALIDCNGNRTEDGVAVCDAIHKFDQDTIDLALLERQMEELDRLDDALRKRPNYRQPPEEFNYGD